MTEDDGARLNPSVSVDHDGNDRVRITVWSTDHQSADLRFLLDPDRALDFLALLANQVSHATTHAAAAMQMGDCATCRNTRLVEVEGPGRNPRNDRCPTCGPRYGPALAEPFTRPRIGGGLA